jgi:low temperature requirement protein LtrA
MSEKNQFIIIMFVGIIISIFLFIMFHKHIQSSGNISSKKLKDKTKKDK